MDHPGPPSKITSTGALDISIINDVYASLWLSVAAVMMQNMSIRLVILPVSFLAIVPFAIASSPKFPILITRPLPTRSRELTDLREMLAEVIRSALEDEALAAGLSTRLSDMKARLERLETRAKRKRELALQAMSEAEIAKLMEADFTASLRQGAPAA